MPAPYSTDLRQRVIDAYKANEGSQRQLAKRFKVSLSFVQRLIRRHENTGQVTANLHAGGARAKITVETLPIVQQLVNEQPDALLEELCARLQERSGLKVSIPTMRRAVHRLGLTTKKKRCMPVSKIAPYSPDLSPIELCWSKLKQCLRAAKARTTETQNLRINANCD